MPKTAMPDHGEFMVYETRSMFMILFVSFFTLLVFIGVLFMILFSGAVELPVIAYNTVLLIMFLVLVALSSGLLHMIKKYKYPKPKILFDKSGIYLDILKDKAWYISWNNLTSLKVEKREMGIGRERYTGDALVFKYTDSVYPKLILGAYGKEGEINFWMSTLELDSVRLKEIQEKYLQIA